MHFPCTLPRVTYREWPGTVSAPVTVILALEVSTAGCCAGLAVSAQAVMRIPKTKNDSFFMYVISCRFVTAVFASGDGGRTTIIAVGASTLSLTN
jgi:hypothetical protein